MKWTSAYVVFGFLTKAARGLIIPKLIAPAEYGLFTSLGVLLAYASYADLGVKYQLGKTLPYELAQEGEPAYRKLAGQGATWTLGTASLVALAVFAASFFQHGEHAWFYAPALRITALIILANRLREFLTITLVSHEEFRWAVSGHMIADSVSLVLTVGLLYFVGLIGAVWALFMSEAAGTVYVVVKSRIRPQTLRGAGMSRRMRESFLLLGVALLDATMNNVDQLFLLKFFPKQQYGIYSLGLAFQAMMLAIVTVLISNLQPRVMGLVGEGRRSEANALINSSLTLFVLLAVLALTLLVPAMAVVVRFYLPKYASGIPTFVILIGFALMRGPAVLLRPFYLAQNQEKRLLGYQVLALATAALMDTIVILRGGGLTSIAVASFLGYGAVSCLMLVHFERTSDHGVSLGKYVMMGFGAAVVAATCLGFRSHVFPEHFLPYLRQAAGIGMVSLLLVSLVAIAMRRQIQHAARQLFSH